MLRLATDADVHGEIIRGLRRRLPEIDLVRAQDALPQGTADPAVLAWAAVENRVLITNDRNTMIGFACKRAAMGEPVPGVIATTNEQYLVFIDIARDLYRAHPVPRVHCHRLPDALGEWAGMVVENAGKTPALPSPGVLPVIGRLESRQ